MGPTLACRFRLKRAQGDAWNGIASEIRAWMPVRVRDTSRISQRRDYHAGTSVWRDLDLDSAVIYPWLPRN